MRQNLRCAQRSPALEKPSCLKVSLLKLVRLVLLCCSIALLTGCATSPDVVTKPISARLIGHVTLPHKMPFQGTVFGGISGLDYDAQSDTFYLLSDDRSDNGPARFYTAKIDYDTNAFRSVTLTAAIILKQADGSPFPNRNAGGEVPDPEAIRFRPDTRTLLWTSEGDKRLGLTPFVREMKWDGSFIRELPRLPMFTMRPNADKSKGPRDNLTFEGMTLSSDQKRVWVSMEGPLYEDGESAKVGVKSAPSRFTEYDVATGVALRQFGYEADAIPTAPIPPTAFADNGVPEILMRDQHRMLVLERAFATGVGTSIRLYEVDVRSGEDTLAIASLRDKPARPVAKKLVVDFANLGLPRLDNTEAMAWGRRLPNGNRTLVLAADDNFSPTQINQFVVLEIVE
jgi:hypothetical protein